jgi:hypothetical protein
VDTPLARRFKRAEPDWDWKRECKWLGIFLVSVSVLNLAAMAFDVIPLNILVPIAFLISFLVIGVACLAIMTGKSLLIRYVPVSLRRMTLATFALTALAFVDIFLIGGFWEVQRNSLEAYTSKVMPQLEAYRQAHGFYPNTLDELSDIPAVPKYLQYSTKPGSYTFSFSDQSGTAFFPADYIYTSESHRWITDD